MRMRTATLITLALAVIVVVIAVVIGQLPAQVQLPGEAPVGAAASSAPESAEPHRTAAPDEPAPDGSPAPDAGGQEDNPPGEKNGPLGPPAIAPAKPLISAPLPPTASGSGVIVEGFPSAVISLAQGSTVISSSVASGDDRVQAGLNAMSTIAPAEVLAYYNAAFAKLGLVASSVPSADGSMAEAFVRGPSTVTVTVSSAGGGSRYSVFGVLVAGA